MNRNLYDDGLTIAGVLIAMLCWSFFYLILSWYIERIFPGEYGVKMPVYFPIMVCIIKKNNIVRLNKNCISLNFE
jgi:hypothetical protein